MNFGGSFSGFGQQGTTAAIPPPTLSSQPSSGFNFSLPTAQQSGTSMPLSFGTPPIGAGGATTSANFLGQAATSSAEKGGTGYATNLFGTQQQPPMQNATPFGSSNQSTGGLFGAGTANYPPTTASLFGGSGTAASNQAQQKTLDLAPTQPASSASTLATPSSHPFQYIQQCYDPSSANYRFRSFFYNVLPEGDATKYNIQRPPTVSERLWEQVLSDNPDPSRMVPVLANGFDDLAARAHWQDEQVSAHQAKLAELGQRMSSLLANQDLEITSKLSEVGRHQLNLARRTLVTMKKVERLRRSAGKNTLLQKSLREKLEKLEKLAEMLRKSHVDERMLRSLASHVQMLADAGRLDPMAQVCHITLADPQSLDGIFKILEEQQHGLQQLVGMIKKDDRDSEIMLQGYRYL